MSTANKKLQKLSLSIGDFIRYWGFRRVHGAIWTQLYVSKIPLSCSQLTKKLALSKSLISPALEELCYYKLIYEVPSPNEKTKLYMASDDITKVIKNILQTREAKMLKKINENFLAFKENAKEVDDLNTSRLNNLENMILSATLMLELMLMQENIMNITQDLKI